MDLGDFENYIHKHDIRRKLGIKFKINNRQMNFKWFGSKNIDYNISKVKVSFKEDNKKPVLFTIVWVRESLACRQPGK